MIAGVANGKTKAYTEKLSAHRMQFLSPSHEVAPQAIIKLKSKKNKPITAVSDITQQLHDLLVDLKAYYAMNDAIQGYTIQVYAGGSRETAFKMRNLLYMHYPLYCPEVHYKQPNFTVRIGKFLDRLEAYKLYIPIKKLVSQAIIRPASFPNEPGIFQSPSFELMQTDTIQWPGYEKAE